MIIPYFGQFPDWFDLFLYSCGKNAILDFMIFTDIPYYKDVPKNVYFKNISFEGYCERVSDLLGVRFRPTSPYKLCDLRPWYGKIHQQEIAEYGFWGFGDIDLVFGKLSDWLLPFFTSKKDVFSTHADRLSGHFALFRNNEKYRNAAFSIKDWQRLVCEERHYGIDEGLFTTVLFCGQRWLRGVLNRLPIKQQTRNVIYNSLNPFLMRNIYAQELGTTPHPKENQYGLYCCESAKCMWGGVEVPYLHFLFFKESQYWEENQDFWKDDFYLIDDILNKDIIRIDKKGISKYKEEYENLCD